MRKEDEVKWRRKMAWV